jgi:plasmid stabilization system protein ParE
MKFRIHPEAQEEADRAADWYGEREGPLGIEFARIHSLMIRDIYLNPRRYAIAEDSPEGTECRNVLHLGRFPYRIVYALVDDDILIVAVAHHRQRPQYWIDRLNDPVD